MKPIFSATDNRATFGDVLEELGRARGDTEALNHETTRQLEGLARFVTLVTSLQKRLATVDQLITDARLNELEARHAQGMHHLEVTQPVSEIWQVLDRLITTIEGRNTESCNSAYRSALCAAIWDIREEQEKYR